MKKFILLFICLFAMVISANAEGVLSGVWKTIDGDVTIEFSQECMKITQDEESLVLFREVNRRGTLEYYCMFKLPSVGIAKIDVDVSHDIFDSTHMTLELRFWRINKEKKYRLIKQL